LSDPHEVPTDEVTAVFDRMAGRQLAKAPGKPPRDRQQPIDRITDLEDALADLDRGNPFGRIARLEEGLAALAARVARIESTKPEDPPPSDPPDLPDLPGLPDDRGGTPKAHT
jgi:hypothetical protein